MALDGLRAHLVRKYGEGGYLWDELAEYIDAELACETHEERQAIYRAISRSCRMSDGFPDVAAVRAAVWRYESEGLGRITRRMGTYTTEPVNVETRSEYGEQLARAAAEVGIDTSRDGWLVRYAMIKAREAR